MADKNENKGGKDAAAATPAAPKSKALLFGVGGEGEDGDQQQVSHLHGGLRPCDGGCLEQSRPVMMSAPGTPGAKTPYLTTARSRNQK
jgi:hypothetical protein